ncbi:MAG: IscS subfamily cysteine desulfurase [Rickettsiales bacterium]|nr:IscS subfamily cysteine desulfurase [Rickettsiales bacterium]|tara:strand:- start:210 stop:1466 length:1257 start_codon:yes stop_codon:yes gene_type:complete
MELAVNNVAEAGTQRKGLPIFMDYQSTTPCDPRVVDTMIPWLTEKFGNPHSRSHAYGWEAEEATEIARQHVAGLIGANPKEIVFTSGATESNNIAIKGVAQFYKEKKNHIVTLTTEHKCVLDSCRHLEQQGFDVTYLKVQNNGLVNLDDLKAAITDKTVMVSIMAVNNEIGVIQPLKDIGAICREKGVFFHTDAAQAFGKIPLDVEEMNIDLMSISGHKIYGPKGVGALFVRRRPRVRIQPLITGGGQERGLRSGTLATHQVVGLGEAARIAKETMGAEAERVRMLSDRFLKAVMDEVPDVYLNGDREHRWPGCINLSFAYIEGESMIMAIKELAVSSGSACTSASLEPSYVLHSIGVGDDLAHTSIRFGIGRFTTEEEIDRAIQVVRGSIEKLRSMSPLWEMAQEGIDINSIEWSGH